MDTNVSNLTLKLLDPQGIRYQIILQHPTSFMVHVLFSQQQFLKFQIIVLLLLMVIDIYSNEVYGFTPCFFEIKVHTRIMNCFICRRVNLRVMN